MNTIELLSYIKKEKFIGAAKKIVFSSIDDVYGLDISILSEKVFKVSTKKTRKALMEFFNSEKPNLNTLILFKKLSNLGISNDLVFNYLNINNDYWYLKNVTSKFLKQIHQIYNSDRLLKIINNKDFDFYVDTEYMLKKVSEKRNLDFLPKKPSSLKEIHDSLSRMSSKLDIDDFNLNQRDDVLKMDNILISGGYTIKIPKTHYDLIDLGEDLHFCIGNGMYSNDVVDGVCSIAAIYKDNKAIFGIQFNRYALNQAYGFDNTLVPTKILLEIQKLLVSEPIVPDDFISISDSKWINGFKYNDKDLFIMMNKKIYVYFNVEHDTYEELIKSYEKGRYVNEVVKRNYEFKKVA